MGCANSRLDDLPAVGLCRERCLFMDEALRTSHSMAEAHSVYLDSLKSLPLTLSTFFSRIPPPPIPNSSDEKLRLPSESDEDKCGEKKTGLNLVNEDETRRLIAHNFGGGERGDLVSTKPPSPPPATIGSAWDFLNLFDTFEKYERLYCESNLEFDLEKPKQDIEEKRVDKDGDLTKAHEVKAVEKSDQKAIHDSAESESSAMDEVWEQFVRASESGNKVMELLYHCHRPTASLDSFRLYFDDNFGLSSRNLASSLKKLALWEKKLYCEVKAEEKLRLTYQKKLQELKYMNTESVKLQKIDSTRALLRDLTTKLKIAFQIVDRISIAINKTRDEELWPQIKELNQRLLPMWKSMLECHKFQYQKVAEAKGLDAILSSEKLNIEDIRAAIQLKLELQTWNLSFSNWVLTQKNYIKSLNGWLTRCLLYEPEETPDGLIPFSPERLGAPPIFIICNQWSQSIERLSEREVIGSIQEFISRIDALLKEHNVDIHMVIVTDKEMERKVKILERQEQKIQKVKGNDNECTKSCNDLQQGMMQIFMAVEKFMENSIQVYDELRIRIEEVGEKPPESLNES